MHMNLYLTHICLKEASQGFLTARDLDTNKARALEVSTCQTNMAAGCDRTIVSEKVCLNSLTRYSFYAMKSRVQATAPVIFVRFRVLFMIKWKKHPLWG